MKGYMRPRNTVKQIEKAKYEAFKKHCMKVTALCSLAILNDVFDFPDEDLQKLSENFGYCYDHQYDEKRSVVRFCTSWATKEENIKALIKTLESL